MKIKGVTEAMIRAIAEQRGFKIANVRPEGKSVAFVLRPGKPWGREHRFACFGHSGRLVSAVCFHGHYDFMEQIFRHNPKAVIVTTMARYDGREDFDRKWRGVGGGFTSTQNCNC